MSIKESDVILRDSVEQVVDGLPYSVQLLADYDGEFMTLTATHENACISLERRCYDITQALRVARRLCLPYHIAQIARDLRYLERCGA